MSQGEEKIDIFCSLRFGNSMYEARQVQEKLKAKHNINAVIINVPEGEDIANQVAQKLDKARLVLIFGCETYGQGTVSFSTKEELRFILSEKRPYFLIKMCDRFIESNARMAFHDGISYKIWKHGEPMPEDLVSSIVKRFEGIVGHDVPAVAAGVTTDSSGAFFCLWAILQIRRHLSRLVWPR